MAGADDLEVLESPEKRGRVVIRSGPYEINFVPGDYGHAKLMGFTFKGATLMSTFIPRQYFIPAARRANIILSDRRRRKQNRLPSHSIQFR